MALAKHKGLKISDELTLPRNAVTSTIVVYGGKGMGKTNFGAVLVEELSANGLRWSVLDPMGVWWGMRHSADGKGNGVECLILGGAHGDIPIEPTGGAVIADLVADETANVIIDISRKANGEMWNVSERIRFANDYGKQLFRRQGSLVDGQRREPLCQVIDEAARYIPQMIRAGQPEVAMCANTWSTIVEEGRNVGLGVVLLTQRSARLNKDVAELADVMLAFRTVGPNSIDAVMDWLGDHIPKDRIRSMVETVRSLPVGSCLAVSPGWLNFEKVIHIRRRNTFDSSATPKPGEKAARVKGAGAKPNLHVYAERMRETIERAKENSPTELKAKIRALESQLARKQPAPAPKPTVDPRLKQENAELQWKLANAQKKTAKLQTFFEGQVWPMLERMRSGLSETNTPTAETAPIASIETHRPLVPERPTLVARTPLAVSSIADVPTGAKLGAMASKIAGIAAGYAKNGEGLDKKLLAALCGATMGGSFANRISEARIAGAITTEGSMVYGTPAGIAAYGNSFVVPTTTEEVLSLWLPKLGKVSRQILEYLVSLGGESVTRAQLADAVGATMGGSFANRLSEVRTTGLLTESGSNVAANTRMLFLRGEQRGIKG